MAAILTLLSLLSLYLSPTLAEDAFTVTAPKAGDTVSVGRGTTSNVEVQIAWTVPDAIADRPVLISLVQGNNLTSLSHVDQLNSSAPNSGEYTWRGQEFNSPLVYEYGYGAPSGCNYSIELKVWTDVVYSGYFTIVNPSDGGLSQDAVCPDAGAAIGPTNHTFTASSNSKGDQEASSTSSTSTGEAPKASTEESKGSGGGVSTTTLAVAVAVPIVVLLVIFGLILWLGIRKGWFVRKSSPDVVNGAAAEKGDVVVQSNDEKAFGGGNEPGILSVRELHANHRPHQLESSAVHELQGGGGNGGQHYVVRN